MLVNEGEALYYRFAVDIFTVLYGHAVHFFYLVIYPVTLHLTGRVNDITNGFPLNKIGEVYKSIFFKERALLRSNAITQGEFLIYGHDMIDK